MKLLLDTGVLGQICHPRKHQEVRSWFRRAVREHEFLISEVADYELRRELLRIDSRRSLARLDELTRELQYLPTTTATWRAAARLWATQRRAGHVGGEGLDGDVLIVAQAIEEAAAVVTFNERHFAALVDALAWSAVPLAET
ncbi:MAG TPA: PIN domain-containing protein [Kofleriaceae bacterium]